MNRNRILPALAALALVGAYLFIQNYRGAPAPPPAGQPPQVNAPAPDRPRASAGNTSPAFRSRAALDDHFKKHGHEFGRITIDDYLARAQALRDAPVGGPILELRRESDGVVTRFDRSTGAFGAYNRDGTIRTFFKPNDGEAYFRRQANREPQR